MFTNKWNFSSGFLAVMTSVLILKWSLFFRPSEMKSWVCITWCEKDCSLVCYAFFLSLCIFHWFTSIRVLHSSISYSFIIAEFRSHYCWFPSWIIGLAYSLPIRLNELRAGIPWFNFLAEMRPLDFSRTPTVIMSISLVSFFLNASTSPAGHQPDNHDCHLPQLVLSP